MEEYFTPQSTWGNLLATAIFLLAIFLLLKVLERMLGNVALPGRVLSPVKKGLQLVRLFFEPIALLLLAGIFVFIRPGLHGVITGIVLAGGFGHIRNYLSGHIVRLDEKLSIGNRLRTADTEGVVTFAGRRGVQLRTSEGEHFTTYTRLLAGGYTLVTGEEAGGFHQLHIWPKADAKNGDKPIHPQQIFDLLATAPYLDGKFRPEVKPDPGENKLTAKILVSEEHHLFELLDLLEEAGLSVRRYAFENNSKT